MLHVSLLFHYLETHLPFFFLKYGLNDCKQITRVAKPLQKNNKIGPSLRWTIRNAEKSADLFSEVSDPRAAHMAVCSDAQPSMQYAFGES